MHSIKRMLFAMLAVTATFFVAIAFAASADAAPYTSAPTLSASTANPAVGGVITVAGTDFAPGTTVELTLHSAVYLLGTATVGPAGAFSATVTLPAGVSGSHTVVASDPVGNTLLTASLAIVIGSTTTTVGAPVAAGGSTPVAAGSGGLAFTGVAVFSIVAVGLLLLVGGGVMVLTGRRRKASL